MTAFPDRLAALRQRATKGPWRHGSGLDEKIVGASPMESVCNFGRRCKTQTDRKRADSELIIFLANHAEAIEKVVRAAEMAQESLARHEEACKGWIDDHHLNTKLALRDALNELEGKG